MKSVMRDLLQTVLLALLLFLAMQALTGSFEVNGPSMVPNLVDGQRIMVNKAVYFHIKKNRALAAVPFLSEKGNVLYLFHPPKRGEIIVADLPPNPSQEIIKRIIGLPGEVVEIKMGKVYINGVPLKEPYLVESTLYEMPPLTIPQDHYFILGDNRNISSDSHSWGTLPYNNIVGKAWLSYWPPGRWRLVPNYSSE